MKRLYHTTTADCADAIMAEGFRDHATELGRSTIVYTPRVWFAPMLTISHAWFDASMMWADEIYEVQTFITIDVPLPFPRSICSSEDPDQIVEVPTDGAVVAGILRSDCAWPCTQFWGPADIWNKFPRTLLKLDDAIRLRLAAEPRLIGKMKQRLMLADHYDRDEFFQALVRRILVEDFQVKGLSSIRPSYLDQPTSGMPSLPRRPQFKQPPRKILTF